jgi:hypothetical protein
MYSLSTDAWPDANAFLGKPADTATGLPGAAAGRVGKGAVIPVRAGV